MELKNLAKNMSRKMLKESPKLLRQGIVCLVLFLLGNVVQEGFVIKTLGGVTENEYTKYQWDIGKIDDGIIYRSDDLNEEKEVLRKKIHMTGKGVLVVCAEAGGKYKDKSCTQKEGIAEIFIYVDDVEVAHGSSYVGDCPYRNDAKSLSTATFVFSHIDEGDHDIKVVAVYYGILERDETKFRYFHINEAHKIN